MKMHRIFVGIVAGAILILGTGATAQESSIDPGVFRERLINWAWASEKVLGPGADLVGKINALSDEQIQTWISIIEDPDAFLRSIEHATIRLENPMLPWTPVVKAPTDIAARTSPMDSAPLSSPTTLTTPFSPDYPPGSGPYKDTIIDAITGFGIGGASSTNRCDASDWGDFMGVWWPLNKAIDTLDGACVVAGCDPIGLICAGVCGILETAKIALKVAAVPLEACDVHQGAIDGAEIEATYENTLGLVGDVSHVHGDLATHDADIQALLATLQATVDANGAKLDTLLARQLETIRLLHTPQGQRQSDVPGCNGGPCDWPNRP